MLWGTSGVFSVTLFRAGLDAGDVAFLRPVSGWLVLLVTALLVRRDALRLPREALVPVLLAGGGLAAAFQLVYQLSTHALGVPATSGLLYLAPVLVMATSAQVLGERASRLQVALGVVAVAGVWLVVGGARGDGVERSATGIVWGLLTAATYAGYTLLGRFATPRWGTFPTVLHSYGAACLILLILRLAGSGLPRIPADPATLAVALGYGVATIAGAGLLFFEALRHLAAHRVSVLTTLEPVVAALLATSFIDQRLSPAGWGGLLLVVGGVAGATALRPEEGPA